MKNKKMWVIISLIVLLLGGCFGDRLVSEVVFAYQCKNNVDVSVYETVKLDDSYIIPIPDAINKRDSRFAINDSQMMNYEKISNYFEIKFYEKNIISSFGPVQSIKTSIINKKNGQILARVITFRNNMGWASNIGSNIITRKHCPWANNKNSRSVNNQFHEQIIKKVFILSKKGA